MINNDDDKTATQAITFPSFASLKAAHSELLERAPEDEEDAEYFNAVEEFFNQARETGALLSDEEERHASQSILNYWLTVLYRADRKPQLTTLAQLRPDLRPNLKDAVCPYPGPREFFEEEGKYFYGRYGLIEYLLARLKVESLLVLLGPSGRGKSSLVQAGLIPALHRLDSEDEPHDGKMHFFPVITPGRNPLKNLAAMLEEETKLGPEANAKKLYDELRAAPDYLQRLVQEHIKTPAVIVVDQFEEIFTLCLDAQVREAFVKNLMGLNDGRNKIILCITDDNYNKELSKLPALKEPFKRASAVLPKLGLSELTDAIVKPAEMVGLKFKEQTVKDIVQEIANESIGLPLLQFTLLKLWEKRVGDETPDEFSRRVGSCRQILSQSAESLFEGFNAEQKAAAQEVLARLIKVDSSLEARIRPVLREKLKEIEGRGEVLNAMEKAHIVRLSKGTQPSDVQVELVHESLLSEWSVTRNLAEKKKRRRSFYREARNLILVLLLVGIGYVGYRLIEKREAKLQHERQSDAANKWAAESGKELAGKNVDLAFLLGLAAHQAEDNLNTRGALLDILHYSPMPKAFIKSDSVMTGDVALSSDGQLLAANDDKGLIRIWNLSQRQAPPVQMRDETILGPESESQVIPLVFSFDGRVLASGSNSVSSEGTVPAVALWDVATGGRRATLKAEKSAGEISCIAFAPGSERLAAGGTRGTIYLWDNTADGSVPRILRKQERSVNDLQKNKRLVSELRFSPDGEQLASGFNDGSVIIWDVKSGSPQHVLNYICNCLNQTPENPKEITGLAFDRQGNMLFVGSTEDVVIYGVKTGSPVSKLSSDQHNAGMFLSLSEDDKTLQGVDSRGGFYLWDVEKPDRGVKLTKKKLFRPVASSWSISFSRDGNTVALSGDNGLSAWDLAGQRHLFGHKNDVNGVAFSPDSRVLASADNDGRVILWDAANRKLRRELPSKERAWLNLAFSHAGGLLAVESLTGSVALWNVSDEQDAGTFLEKPSELEEKNQEVSAIAFGPEDKALITFSAYVDYANNETGYYINAWDVARRQLLKAPSKLPLAAGEKVTSAAFSPDGTTLALATEAEGRSTVTLWDALNRTPGKSLQKDLKGRVMSLALSANGKWVAAGEDEESRVVLWNSENGKTFILSLEGQPGSVSHLAFTADGKILSVSIDPEGDDPRAEAAPGETHMIVLWDISFEAPKQQGSAFSGLAIPNSDATRPQQLGSALSGHEFSTTALAFSPDSKLLAIADANRSLMIWDIDVGGAKAIICGIANRKFTDEELEHYKAGIDLTNPCD